MLVDIINRKCECGNNWIINEERRWAHVITFKLKCEHCGTIIDWEGSKQNAKGAYEVNIDATFSYISSAGISFEQYKDFTNTWDIGHVSRTSFFNHQQHLALVTNQYFQLEVQQIIKEHFSII